MSQTISDIVSDVQRALEYVARNPNDLPGPLQGLRHIAPASSASIEVSLLKNDRRIKKTAASHNWQPEAGQVLISYAPAKETVEPAKTEPAAQVASQAPLADFLIALDRVEGQYPFVALKLFRDKVMLDTPSGRNLSSDDRQRFVKEAIDNGWLLTSRMQNPKSPEFPTTAIRLNRAHPKVREALSGTPIPAPRFRPVVIPGEPLSKTILAERR